MPLASARMGTVGVGALFADKYRVVGTIADGGMGAVREAVHVETGERFALKILGEAAMRDDAARLRFTREIRANGRLRGRHVTRIVDSGDFDGLPFMVLELLEGTDLAREIKQVGPLAVADACAVMTQVACGLAEAHSQGIIHRDVKPGNVFLARVGAQRIAKVLDFGVAKLESGDDDSFDDQLTRSFSSLGTPAYMSPEQIRSATNVDRATDVWSFSLVLFRALAGKLPFGGNASSIPFAICNDPPLPLRELRPGVPSDLVDIVEAGLEKDRRLRPTLADLGDVLIAHVDASSDASIAHEAYTELARLSLADL